MVNDVAIKYIVVNAYPLYKIKPKYPESITLYIEFDPRVSFIKEPNKLILTLDKNICPRYNLPLKKESIVFKIELFLE
jgi:hypothetical protein